MLKTGKNDQESDYKGPHTLLKNNILQAKPDIAFDLQNDHFHKKKEDEINDFPRNLLRDQTR